MKFKEYDTVKIIEDHNQGIKKGTIGAIIMAFDEPQEAYEVEILGADGKTKTQGTFFPNDLELVRR